MGSEAKPLSSLARRNGWRTAGWWLVGWIPAIIGLVAWVVVFLNQEPHFLWLALLIFTFVSCLVVSVILHELGHYLGALLVGLKPLLIGIGHGESLVLKRFKSACGISLRALPFSGFVLVWPKEARFLRLRWGLMVFSGPLVNILLAFAALWIMMNAGDWPAKLGAHDRAGDIVGIMLYWNAVIIVCSLLPYRTDIADGEWPNDGSHLFKILSSRTFRPWPDYSQYTEKQRVEESKSWSKNWVTMTESVDVYVLLEAHERMLSEEASEGSRLTLLDGFATTVLMYNARNYLGKADEYSAELFAANPNEWTVRGTRGSVLVETGRIEEGIETLQGVVANDPVPFDKAISAAFIAIGEIKRGRYDDAKRWLDQARAWEPDCVPLKRAEQMLKEVSNLPYVAKDGGGP
jgi:Peptidase family M50